MIYPFLNLFPDLRFRIYQDVITPDLFHLMETCRLIRTEGLIELKGRIQRLGIRCPDDWGVLQCKQAYLWHFGEPEMIFEREVPPNLSANLCSRGVVFVGKDNNFQGATMQTFKDWRSSSDNKRLIPIQGLPEKMDASDIILFIHRGRDYLLVHGVDWRLIDLTDMIEVNLGKAKCCTVDAVSSANYLITYQYKSSGVGIVRWCDFSQLIRGEAQWRECIVNETPYHLQLDVSQNQIVVLEMIPGESPGQQRGTINMESGQWVRLTHRPEHQPHWDSPIYRMRQRNTVKQVAIGGVPCYQWDLRKYGEFPPLESYQWDRHEFCEFPPLEMRRAVNEGLAPQTIRALHTAIQLRSEVVTVQSMHNGCWPILNIVYRVNQVFMCKTWRLIPPSQPYSELECVPSTTYVASDLREEQWGENVIIRALRVGAHWAWEPLMHLLGKRLIEELQNEDEDPDQGWLELWVACDNILNAAAVWNRSKFVEFFFHHWLPSLEKEVKEMSIIEDIDSKSSNSIDLLMRHLVMACQLGHVEVALNLIKCSALNTSLPHRREDLVEWPPLKGAMYATYGLQWSAVIPIITAQGCSERDRIILYQHILKQHIRFSGYRESDPEGFAKMVVDLCNSEPALLDTTEAIAAAAVITNKDLIGRVTEQAEIDLPSYNGEFDQWEGVAHNESLIFHAIQGLEALPEAKEWFIDWLVNRNLREGVEEALELMRPQWRKRQRSQSPQ